VRLLVAQAGAVRTERRPHVPAPGPLQIRVARNPIDSRDVWLYHKTTHRKVYERAREGAGACDDVLLWNEHGHITETTNCNVVVEMDGVALTPPVSCGLLAGTCRAAMLANGSIREGIVTLEDVRRATAIWLINSVHDRRPAVLVS
jgi:para-aminobenzoate synthetase/4-amino-4-deoxychorismate lyase